LQPSSHRTSRELRDPAPDGTLNNKSASNSVWLA
jgi:hypothetical protein